MTQNFFEHNGNHYLRVSAIIAALKGPMNINKAILEAKAKIGTEVHDLCQRHLYGEEGLTPTTQRAANYFECFKKFNKNKILGYPLLCEYRMFDDELGITGQLDLICPVQGTDEYILVDLKTTAAVDKLPWGFQGVLYCKMLMQCRPDIKLADTFSFIQLKEKGNAKVVKFPNWKKNLPIATNMVKNFMSKNRKTLQEMYELETNLRKTKTENSEAAQGSE